MDRPGGDIFPKDTIDEVRVLCEALCLSWSIAPDCYWMGLHVLLETIVEKLPDASMRYISPEAIEVLKSIAKTTQWPNNPVCGPLMMVPAAKSALVRISTGCSFGKATVNRMIRSMTAFDDIGGDIGHNDL